MKKNIYFIAFFFIIQPTVFSQPNCDSLMQHYGITHSSTKLFINADNYVFAGNYYKTASGDTTSPSLYITELDTCGNVIRNKYYAPNSNNYSTFYTRSVNMSENGNIFSIISADSTTNINADTHNQIRVLKINDKGKLLWTTVYSNSLDNVPYGVCPTQDGGAVVGGWKGNWAAFPNTTLLVKFDSNGNVEWAKSYGEGLISSIKQTADSGYVFIRFLPKENRLDNNFTRLQSFICKADNKGKLLWSVETPPTYRYKYFDQYDDQAVQVLPSKDNNSYIVVRTQGSGFYPDTVFVTKYDQSGNLLWNKAHSELQYQDIRSVQNTTDNGYLLGGSYNVSNDTFGVYAIKLNNTGDTEWTKRITDSYTTEDYPHIYTSVTDAYETENNKFVFGGLLQTNLQNGNIHYSSLLIKMEQQKKQKIINRTTCTQHNIFFCEYLSKSCNFILRNKNKYSYSRKESNKNYRCVWKNSEDT